MVSTSTTATKSLASITPLTQWAIDFAEALVFDTAQVGPRTDTCNGARACAALPPPPSPAPRPFSPLTHSPHALPRCTPPPCNGFGSAAGAAGFAV
jgi:hypothetical protein